MSAGAAEGKGHSYLSSWFYLKDAGDRFKGRTSASAT